MSIENNIAYLKGLDVRLIADSYLDDLKKVGIISLLENSELINVPIYKNHNNNILIKLDNNYITFVERNCFDVKERNLK